MTRFLFFATILLALGCKPSPEGQKVRTSDPVAVQNASAAEAELSILQRGNLTGLPVK